MFDVHELEDKGSYGIKMRKGRKIQFKTKDRDFADNTMISMKSMSSIQDRNTLDAQSKDNDRSKDIDRSKVGMESGVDLI